MKGWARKGYRVQETEFDFDLHHFEVIKSGEVIATIMPHTIEDMQKIINDLNNGDDVHGWEDGMGGTVNLNW